MMRSAGTCMGEGPLVQAVIWRGQIVGWASLVRS